MFDFNFFLQFLLMISYFFWLFKAQFAVLSMVFAKRSFPAMLTDIFRTGAKSVQNLMVFYVDE